MEYNVNLENWENIVPAESEDFDYIENYESSECLDNSLDFILENE